MTMGYAGYHPTRYAVRAVPCTYRVRTVYRAHNVHRVPGTVSGVPCRVYVPCTVYRVRTMYRVPCRVYVPCTVCRVGCTYHVPCRVYVRYAVHGTRYTVHGIRYVRYGRGGYALPLRTVRGAWGQALRRGYVQYAGGRYAQPVRTVPYGAYASAQRGTLHCEGDAGEAQPCLQCARLRDRVRVRVRDRDGAGRQARLLPIRRSLGPHDRLLCGEVARAPG